MNDPSTIDELADLLQRVATIADDPPGLAHTPSGHGSGRQSGHSQPQAGPTSHTPLGFQELTAWIRTQTPTTNANAVSPTHHYMANSIPPAGGSLHGAMTPLRGPVGTRTHGSVSPMPALHGGASGRSGSIPLEYCMPPMAGSPSHSSHGPSASPPQEPFTVTASPYPPLPLPLPLPSPSRFEQGLQGTSRFEGLHRTTPLKQQQEVLPGHGPAPQGGGTPLGGLRLGVEQFRGRVVETVKDQAGCRALQRVLDTYPFDSQEVQQIIDEIVPHVAPLMADPYGNFLIQRLLEIAPDAVRIRLTQLAAMDLPAISTTPHGTFTVQKLIESLRHAEERDIVCAGLASNVPLLMTDTNGSHVVLKLLQCLAPHETQFLYDGMCRSLVAICCDRQGCCIVQKCAEFAFPEQFAQLQQAVFAHVLQLAPDPFGNYVVANMLEHCRRLQQRRHVDECMTAMLPVLPQLSTNKFSSNVVEKALKDCSPAVAATVVAALAVEPVLHDVAFHQYGNYVVQTALVVAPLPQLAVLVQLLQPMLPLLRQVNYGRKIEAKVELAARRLHGGGPPPPPGGSPHSHAGFYAGGASPHSPARSGSGQSSPYHQGHHQPRQTCTPPPMPPMPLN